MARVNANAGLGTSDRERPRIRQKQGTGLAGGHDNGTDTAPAREAPAADERQQ
jgi:SRSO17 transposase